MRENAVRRLPVIEDGQVTGMVSLGDLAMQDDPGSALATVSQAVANLLLDLGAGCPGAARPGELSVAEEIAAGGITVRLIPHARYTTETCHMRRDISLARFVYCQ